MFSLRTEQKKIIAIRARIAAERDLLRLDAARAWPGAKKAAAIGSASFALKSLAPFLKPLALGLAQRTIARSGKKTLFRLALLVGAGFGVWRLLGSDGEE